MIYHYPKRCMVYDPEAQKWLLGDRETKLQCDFLGLFLKSWKMCDCIAEMKTTYTCTKIVEVQL